MRKLSVDVFADQSRPEGGHAVIRLNGLVSLPDSLAFRLKPVDSAQFGDETWPADERFPLVSRLTAEGAELVVGPDIVENPIFLPGTLTAIEVPVCGVRGEFLWPRIPPLMRPKRRYLLGAKPAREGKTEAAEPIAFSEAFDASSDVVPLEGREPDVSRAPPKPGSIDIVQGSAQVLAPPPAAASKEEDVFDERGDVRLSEEALASELGPKVHTVSTKVTPVGEIEVKPDVVWSKPRRAAVSARTLMLSAAATIALVVGGAAYVFAGVNRDRAASGSRESDLVTLLSVGTTSPRGTKTRERTPLELLEAADLLLHAPDATRDRAEAAFMLRRYLTATLSDERTLWALTQLGSVYAEPDGTRSPDYAKSRQLWEMSATLGDPVAMCFLGSLNEYGLGQPASRSAALQWYLRAKDAGGCQRLDDAISRVRK